ncbi:hypothetical protein ONZ51_g1629 [Trametes cubensis]|uniref:Thioredoxin domain-containing protein n=1 Tax=Trametes cubensis TaxID=1111947 RepID=A0AAD7XEN6_9APHY|nr:hypothetical protein ONZ51_g1629 [Trametes cubensis]
MKPLPLAKLAVSFSLLTSRFVLQVASTALSVTSSDVEPLVLTADNFESTIADGVWFVEYMSPYCSYCWSFAPTWEQLVAKTAKKADAGIRLAQVNCAIDGRLCDKNGIVGYPQINLYRNGQFVEMFKQALTIERLTEYLDANAATPVPPGVSTSNPAPIAIGLEADVSVIEGGAKLSKGGKSTGGVVSLDEETFKEAVDEGDVFVKFFLPWGFQSRKLEPTWTQLAREINGRVTIAEVNCQEHSLLCMQEGVTGYPMMFYYDGRGTKTQYTGERNLVRLQTFAEECQDAAELMDQIAPEVGLESSQEMMNAPRDETGLADRAARGDA